MYISYRDPLHVTFIRLYSTLFSTNFTELSQPCDRVIISPTLTFIFLTKPQIQPKPLRMQRGTFFQIARLITIHCSPPSCGIRHFVMVYAGNAARDSIWCLSKGFMKAGYGWNLRVAGDISGMVSKPLSNRV